MNEYEINGLEINGREASYTVVVDESLAVTTSLIASWGMVVAETFDITDTTATKVAFSVAISEVLGLSEQLRFAVPMTVAETIATTSTLVISQSTAIEFAESLVATGTVSTFYRAIVVMAESLALTSQMGVGFEIQVAEALGISSTLTPNYKAVLSVLESLVLGDAQAMSASIYVSMEEAIGVADTLSMSASLSMVMEEGISFGGVIATPDGVYEAWVMNAETHAAWKYTNFPFNSFAFLGGKYLAATDAGLYELVGDDDNGTEIEAVVKTGLMNFGASLKKSIPRAYFGYSSNGALLFKTIATDSGKKIVRWYELKPRVEGSFTVGHAAADWTAAGANTATDEGNAVRITYVDDGTGASLTPLQSVISPDTLDAAERYVVSGLVKVSSGSVTLRVVADATYDEAITSTTYIRFSQIFTGIAGTEYLQALDMSAGESVWIKELSVQKIAEDMQDGRVPMARGVKGTYWQFEITNVDGADFSIDDITLLPTIIKRRV